MTVCPVERAIEVTAGVSSVPQVYMPLLRGSITGKIVDENTLPVVGALIAVHTGSCGGDKYQR